MGMRSTTLTNRLGEKIAGARTLTVGELLGFALGILIMWYMASVFKKWTIPIGLGVIFIAMLWY